MVDVSLYSLNPSISRQLDLTELDSALVDIEVDASSDPAAKNLKIST